MIALAVLVALLYGAGVRSLAGRGRRWPVRRTTPAAFAVVTMAGSGFVPAGTFTGHMIEHIMVGMAVPLLFALSAPVTLALQTAPPGWRRALRTSLHSRLGAWLANPVVGLAVFGLTLVALYLTPLLQWSADHLVVHVAVHLHLLVAGSLFVWPLVGIDPIPCRLPHGARALTVMAAVPFHAFLGIVIISSSAALAPRAYPGLTDQRRAGGLLWASGELMTLVLLTIVVRRWLVAERRSDARADAIADRAMSLP
jgi:putative membrane protein